METIGGFVQHESFYRSRLCHSEGICHQKKMRRVAVSPCPAFRVVPYQPVIEDSLESLSRSKGMTTHELKSLNHELDLTELDTSQSILVPQDPLSKEDRQILEHMIARKYRTYAVKEGETIESIISSRDISREEVEKLNPGSKLDSLETREVIKLPSHKYSSREEYELHGTLGMKIFKPGGWLANTLIAGTLGISLYCVYLYRAGKRHQQALKVAQQKQASKKKYKVPEGMPLPSYMASIDESLNGPISAEDELKE